MDYDEHNRPTNAGGKVTVSISEASIPDKTNEDLYVPGQLQVSWAPNENWKMNPTLLLSFTEYQDEKKTDIQIENYLDEFGHLITDKFHSIYAKLLERFPSFSISEKGGVYELTLTDQMNEMPALTEVSVSFLPTIAVENVRMGTKVVRFL